MVYVPMVTPSPASPRAQELARRLRKTIDEHRSEDPSLTDAEVGQALCIARKSVNTKNRVAVLASAMLAAMTGLLLVASKETGFLDGVSLAPIMIVAAAIVVGLAVVLKNRSGSV